MLKGCYFILSIFTFSISGCSEFPDAGNSGSFTGIYCMLNPQSKHQDVYVVRAVNIEPYKDFVPDTLQLKVSGATVCIKSDSQSVQLTEISEGHYRDTAGILIVKSGKQYTLDVKTPYDDHFTAVTTVPNSPKLLLPNPMDTFTINIHIDTMYFPIGDTSSYLSVNNWPVNPYTHFLWQNDETMKSFYFYIGADTALLTDQYGNTEEAHQYRLIKTRSIIKNPSVTIFGKNSFYEDEVWQWQGPFTEKDNHSIYTDLFINIRTYSLMLSSNNQYLSNIQNGFGYFAATQIVRKPVHVIMNWLIVR